MRKTLALFAAVLIGALPLSAMAAPASRSGTPTTAGAFTDDQKKEVESLIKTYLTEKHPEVLAEAIQALQKRERDETEAKLKEKVVSEHDKLVNDASSPVVGNPKGDIAVVQFYDYQCGYCKASQEAIEKILKDDKDVKFVFKNFPVLGAVSVEAARAALASVKQGKFFVFHSAMMNKKEHLTSELIYQIAKDSGLDVDKLKKDMTDASVEESLDASTKLAHDIGVQGTPFFLIGDAFFPGVMSHDQMKSAISAARSKVKKP